MSVPAWVLPAVAGGAFSVVTGVVASQFYDTCLFYARRLARWSARRRYRDVARAEMRAEEWAAFVSDCSGRVSALIAAIHFAARALVTSSERSMPAAAAFPADLPEPLTLQLNFAPYRKQDAAVWFFRTMRMKSEFDCLRHDIDVAVAAHGMQYWFTPFSERLQRLARATGSVGWVTAGDNVNQLYEALNHTETADDIGFQSQTFAGGGGRLPPPPIPNTTPAETQVEAFCHAVRRCRHDIQQLAGPPHLRRGKLLLVRLAGAIADENAAVALILGRRYR